MGPHVNAYKKNQINTTSNENLVLMLYDGARKFINRGVKSIREGDIEEANNSLLRAQNIISELMAGINFEAGEIARQLYTLYEYMYFKLVQANIKKDPHDCEEVLAMVEELRTVWVQASKSRYAPVENKTEKNLKIS
ncbi:MAG: flagellar export chaperone FliS [Syntrophomonadaceae bacterium]|nr:flagellar export chaperone FliS [Syntrophomonadaceae bacterium]